jgi:hypothetical protein
MPQSQMPSEIKHKIKLLQKHHKRIDEDFLDNRIEPRIVVFIADGVKTDTKSCTWEPKHYANVAININKYIAKYDYEIA